MTTPDPRHPSQWSPPPGTTVLELLWLIARNVVEATLERALELAKRWAPLTARLAMLVLAGGVLIAGTVLAALGLALLA